MREVITDIIQNESLETQAAICAWCEGTFTPKTVGAHQKRFCSVRCKGHYHAAARKWVQRAIGAGLLCIADLKAAQASCTRRGVAERANTVIPLPDLKGA